jgi:hypothetical protein
MQSTNPKNISNALHLIRAGLASGLLTKEEVIDWADKIITRDAQPDIFFIDLAMSSSKSTNDVIHYIGDYLNFENPTVQGRPLVGLLYNQYSSRQIDLERAISKLFRLKFEAVFNEQEEGYIYSLENDYDCAKHGIYGSLYTVQQELEKFLSFYKDYSIDNYDQWNDLGKIVDIKLEEDHQRQMQQAEKYGTAQKEPTKPWWKFW